MRAKEIYDGLIDRWGEVCRDEAWISSIKRDYNLNNKEWTPDCFYLITLSWGPWLSSRQKEVWEKVKNNYPQVVKDLRSANQKFKAFPLPWQNNRVKAISRYLNKESISFTDVVTDLKSLSAIAARDRLAELSGAKEYKKTISCFIRDYFLKDVFPIDRRVDEMLCILGLPNDEDMMIKLCEMDKISARILERMLYSQLEECPNKAPGKNNECGKCRIDNYCWEYVLRNR